MTQSLRLRALITTPTIALTAPAAYGQCVVDGNMMADASNPESGQTITCEDNLDNDGVPDRQADDVTVNINAPAGGISVTGKPGIALGNGATITGSGMSDANSVGV